MRALEHHRKKAMPGDNVQGLGVHKANTNAQPLQSENERDQECQSRSSAEIAMRSCVKFCTSQHFIHGAHLSVRISSETDSLPAASGILPYAITPVTVGMRYKKLKKSRDRRYRTRFFGSSGLPLEGSSSVAFVRTARAMITASVAKDMNPSAYET